MMNEETSPPALDKTTSALFDLGFRISTVRFCLNIAEQLLNQAMELSKERKLQHEDFQQFESLLLATKEFFDVHTGLLNELFESLVEGQ